jgi:hypothetical protein
VWEDISFRLPKPDLILLDKLADAKGSTRSGVLREALHLLFAHHGMLPEEATKMLLGQFLHETNKVQMKLA